MEVIGEFEAEGNCGTCGARLRFKGSDIRGYDQAAMSYDEWSSTSTKYFRPAYYIKCGGCEHMLAIPTYAANYTNLPRLLLEEVKAKRWDVLPEALHYFSPILNPRIIEGSE